MTLRAYLSHGWLPAVLPAGAMRFRVADAPLAYTLAAAGARLVDTGADVEIGPIDAISPDARTAIVCIDCRIRDGENRVRQIVGRLAASADVRLRTAQATAVLRQRGFDRIAVIPWDRDQAIRVPALRLSEPDRLAERFPRGALIIAGRERAGETLLDRVVADAERRTGLRLTIVRPLVSSGTLVVLLADHVLRLAVGPAASLLDQQADALVSLRALNLTEKMAAQIPELLATGSAGLADWSLEGRLPGVHPQAVLPGRLLDAALEFLVTLFHLGQQESNGFLGSRLNRLAAAAPECLPAGAFAAMRDLAADADEELRQVPRAFFHGDFSLQNVLISGNEVRGVVDWAQADPSGLPMLDMLNVELIGATHPGVFEWGPSIAGHLLPLARRGGSEPMRRYARAIGLDFTARQLECLAHAYWLDRVVHQLTTYVERSLDALWLERNVTGVLLAAQGAHR